MTETEITAQARALVEDMTSDLRAKPTADEAWNAVMREVVQVGKNQRATLPGQGSFTFRGIDAVLDAVGPALRSHGVTVHPKRILNIDTVEYQSKGGARMVNKQITVEWEVRGPAGDSFTGESVGEAADAGDKAVAKAQSVAYRVYLEQALCIPTGERDVNYDNHERATEQVDPGALNAANEARGVMLESLQPYGYDGDKLCARFAKDYGGKDLLAVLDLSVLNGFTEVLLAEERAKPPRQPSDSGAKPEPAQTNGGDRISDAQLRKLHTLFSKAKIVDHDAKVQWCRDALGIPLESTKDLTMDEGKKLIEKLNTFTA